MASIFGTMFEIFWIESFPLTPKARSYFSKFWIHPYLFLFRWSYLLGKNDILALVNLKLPF